jgi:hypothetical protein
MNRSSTLLTWKHRWALKLMMQDSRNRLPRGEAFFAEPRRDQDLHHQCVGALASTSTMLLVQ